MGFRLPDGWRALPARLGSSLRERETRLAAVSQQARAAPAEERSRAAQVVDAVAASQRRESGRFGTAAYAVEGLAAPSRRVAPQGVAHESYVAAPVPIGQSYRRRTRTRISASAGRRDRRS